MNGVFVLVVLKSSSFFRNWDLDSDLGRQIGYEHGILINAGDTNVLQGASLKASSPRNFNVFHYLLIVLVQYIANISVTLHIVPIVQSLVLYLHTIYSILSLQN